MSDPTPLSSMAYPSSQDAAIAALNFVRHQAANREWMGAILREMGSKGADYRYTLPQAGNADNFDVKLSVPATDTLAALYHTHPPLDARPSDVDFSPNDVATANALKVPSYIWVGYDGKARVYIPGKSPLYSDREMGGSISPGEPVGLLGP